MNVAAVIVLARIALGVCTGVALVLAIRHIVFNWNMQGKEYLAVFLAAVAIDNVFAALFLIFSVAFSPPSAEPIPIWFLLFLSVPIVVAPTAMAFAGFILGHIGYDRSG